MTVLLFENDPQTGTPRLRDEAGVAGRSTLKMWEKELNRQYEELVDGRGEVTFQAAFTELPRTYRVTLLDGTRSPNLRLESVSDPAPPSPSDQAFAKSQGELWNTSSVSQTRSASWCGGFQREVQRLTKEQSWDRAEQAAVSFALEEMDDLVRGGPRPVALVLLVGYLLAAESFAQQSHPMRAPLYALAREAILRGCPQMFPELGVMHDPSSDGQRSGRHFFLHVLQLLVGWNDDEF